MWRYLVIGTVAVIVTLLMVRAISARHAHGQAFPAGARFTKTGFEAFDGNGRTLWIHTFDRPLLSDLRIPDINRMLPDFVRVGDFLGDGGQELLLIAPLRAGPNPTDDVTTEVDCFSSGGTLLWSYTPHITLTVGERERKDPWRIYDLMVSHEGPKRSIWVLAVHRDWGNSFVVELDPATGRGHMRFVNNGVTSSLRELRTPRGTFLLAAGFNNEYEAGILAVVNERKAFAASPQTTRYKCVSCPAGDPDYYLVFPRSEINGLRKEWLDAVGPVMVKDTEVLLSKIERTDETGVQSLYLVGMQPTVHVISLGFSAPYDMEHREFERKRLINHSLDNCPERHSPLPVRLWTPFAGWTQLSVPPTMR